MNIKTFKRQIILFIAISILAGSQGIVAEKVLPKESKPVLDQEEKQIEELKKRLISDQIPMPLEEQEYLFDLCQKRGLDYIKVLALVKHESNFNPSLKNSSVYGYMQIGRVNHKRLAKLTGTENKPLDPYINLNWGTQILSELYTSYQDKYQDHKLDRAVWSAYNKGCGGFERTGEATRFINKTLEDIQWVREKLNLPEKSQ